ncbi:MAG: efflux RND transporter permease subunit, partial [Spirochaetaceae bacterium]|nr:efflux RND transporter permease subunit [Spirochaetaceae bacterium]
MDIAELSVRRPVLMVMVYILICAIAAVFVPRLGIALTPDIEFPSVSVFTSFSNVGPEEIDTNVTKVLTNQLSRIKGLKKITSTSRTGSSWINLEFGYNCDLDEVTSDVESAIARVSGWLPDGCGSPSVMKFNMSSRPIMRLAVEGDLPINELKTVAEDTVSPFIERVEGVASVDIQGGAAKEIRVDVSTNRLEAYGLSLSSIAAALAARNFQLSSGEITQNGIDYEIITSEYYHNLDDIRQTILSTSNGAVIRVDDIADVYEQY